MHMANYDATLDTPTKKIQRKGKTEDLIIEFYCIWCCADGHTLFVVMTM